MIKNADYWKKRALQREEQASKRGKKILGDILSGLKKTHQDNLRAIATFYAKYAQKNRISYEDAVKTLSLNERKQWRYTLAEYVERINRLPEGEAKRRLIQELDILSAQAQISRLETLNSTIEMNIALYSAENVDTIREGLKEIYAESYHRGMFDLQSRMGVMFPYADLSDQAISEAVALPWSGASFSKRWTRGNEKFAAQVEQELTKGMIQGKSIAQMSKDLADATGRRFKSAENLIRTETNYAHNDATLRMRKEAGVEWYEYVATLDFRTSEICGALDGKIFKTEEAQAGVNYPPMHPGCRSTTVEHDPDEWQDWAAIGQKMPERMTYTEWKLEIDRRNGEGWFDAERKSVRRGDLDKAQHEKYRLIFGDRIPESYQDFKNLKYHSPDKWDIIKSEKTEAIKRLEYSPKLDGSLGNSEVRVWYKNKVSDIPNRVDKSMSIEQQSRWAHSERNKIRSQARDMMADQEARKALDAERPNLSYEVQLEQTISKYKCSREEAIERIIGSSGRSNKDVDAKFFGERR